jgi:hypothetical protein
MVDETMNKRCFTNALTAENYEFSFDAGRV